MSFSVCDDVDNLYIQIKLSDEIDLTEQFYNPAKIYINIDADNNPSSGYYSNGIGSEYGIICLINLFLMTQITRQLILSLYD